MEKHVKKESKPFFVGYLGVPKGLKSFLLKASLLLFAGFAAGGVLAGVSQDDPGQAGFRFDFGRQTVSGVIETMPYPVLHVTKGNDRIATGHTLMLTGQGKNGVMGDTTTFANSVVDATGIVLKRGDLDMIQVGRRMRAMKDVEPHQVETVSLGRWKLSGEICDGKCYAGAMRPGTGLAHKACANLCLVGGVPAVFVSSGPVDGSTFFMLADKEGNALGDELYDLTAVLLSAEGEVEKRGNLHLFKIDLDTVEVQ